MRHINVCGKIDPILKFRESITDVVHHPIDDGPRQMLENFLIAEKVKGQQERGEKDCTCELLSVQLCVIGPKPNCQIFLVETVVVLCLDREPSILNGYGLGEIGWRLVD